jgi:hypothetical protein
LNFTTVSINTGADAAAKPPAPVNLDDKPGSIDIHASTTVATDAQSSVSDSSSSRAIQSLLKIIAQLERQLQQQEQQLQQAMAHATPGDPAGASAVQALQSGIATTMGDLLVAQAQLLQAMTATGNSAGNVVNTSA